MGRVEYVQLPVTSSVNFNLIFCFNPAAGIVLIPAGVFIIVNPTGESDIVDAISTNVMVSAFYMDVNSVSYGQWQTATNRGYNFVNAGSGKAANQPVQTADWFDCVKWCNARSQSEGLIPVYFTDAGLTRHGGECDGAVLGLVCALGVSGRQPLFGRRRPTRAGLGRWSD